MEYCEALQGQAATARSPPRALHSFWASERPDGEGWPGGWCTLHLTLPSLIFNSKSGAVFCR